jgi:hypothetical protein
MKTKKLTPAELQLLAWFKLRPLQKVSAAELRDQSEAIWGRILQDGPRVARSLWEHGKLERENGTRAPYWYVGQGSHAKVAVQRQQALFAQTVRATKSRVLTLESFAEQSDLMSASKARDLKRFCVSVLEKLKAFEAS